jgi:hypothetical protein
MYVDGDEDEETRMDLKTMIVGELSITREDGQVLESCIPDYLWKTNAKAENGQSREAFRRLRNKLEEGNHIVYKNMGSKAISVLLDFAKSQDTTLIATIIFQVNRLPIQSYTLDDSSTKIVCHPANIVKWLGYYVELHSTDDVSDIHLLACVTSSINPDFSKDKYRPFHFVSLREQHCANTLVSLAVETKSSKWFVERRNVYVDNPECLLPLYIYV